MDCQCWECISLNEKYKGKIYLISSKCSQIDKIKNDSDKMINETNEMIDKTKKMIDKTEKMINKTNEMIRWLENKNYYFEYLDEILYNIKNLYE